jgi:glycosyltransferase involved in cell wall biosynthesis
MISVTVLVKNGEKYLSQVLDALCRYDEVLLLDTGSQDKTLEIAKQYPNVTIKRNAFLGFGPSHNLASSLAKHDWILSIDSDEIASKELVDEILSLKLDDHTVYAVRRKNFFRGKFIKGCGWYPDWQFRLYNKKFTSFSDALVHESIERKDMLCKKLLGTLTHYPYATIHDFLHKMQSYSTLFAKEQYGKKKSSLGISLLHAGFAFFKSYIIKRGLFLGKEGFIISLYNAHTAYYKYLKLAEAYENTDHVCEDGRKRR